MGILAFIGGILVAVGAVFMYFRPSLDRARDGELLLWYTPSDDRHTRRSIML